MWIGKKQWSDLVKRVEQVERDGTFNDWDNGRICFRTFMTRFSCSIKKIVRGELKKASPSVATDREES